MAETETVPPTPKEQASVWANRGLPWAVLEYSNLAGIPENERRELMSKAHENAAARYGMVDKQGSAIEGNPLNTPSSNLLSNFVGRLVDGSQGKGGWGADFHKAFEYARVYLMATAQETHLNLLAHRELAEHYKKS